jgi:imidazolonepropionase-like amidohydrolase
MRAALGALLVTTAIATAAPAAAESLRYTAVLVGNVAGEMTVERTAGELRIEFAFNDRGRGPRLVETVRLDAEGVPVAVEIGGHDYLKNPVDERFARDAGGRATWASAVERGETTASGFFAAFHGTPYEVALLAQALARRSDRRLALLPSGSAGLEEMGSLEVETPAGRRTVRHVAITGLGFTPTSLWLDADGELFATADTWFSLVREGWEPVIERLVAAQREASTRRWREVAARVSRRPAGALVFRNARLFDPATLAASEGTTVVVEGERIASVGRDGEVAIPADAEVVDAGGRTLLPGLWDMHTHVGELDGALHLAAGVTSVRDLANDVDELTRLARSWDSGETLGPRVRPSGFLDGPGPYAGPTKALVDTAEAGRDWIRRYAELGYRQVKLYSSLKPELVAPLAAEAHRLGMRVSGHVPAGMIAERAVRDGYDEIQHINMVVLNFFPEIVETRTPARFTEVAARAVEIDPASDRFQAFARFLRERGTVVDPTVSIFRGMFLDRPGEISGEYAAIAQRLPPTAQRGLLAGGLPVPEGMAETYARSADRLLEMIAALHRAGVTIVAGTDNFAGFALHREMALYVQAGIPAPEVLRLATLGAARVAGLEGELGSVRAGKLADFVLVDGRPDERIDELRRVRTVVKGGVTIDAGALYRDLGVEPEP